MGYHYAKFSGQCVLYIVIDCHRYQRVCLPETTSVLCWHISYLILSFSLLVYKQYGSTCLSSVVLWNALPVFWISDADAIKTLHSSRVVFPKDIEAVGHFDPSVGDANAEIGFFRLCRSTKLWKYTVRTWSLQRVLTGNGTGRLPIQLSTKCVLPTPDLQNN